MTVEFIAPCKLASPQIVDYHRCAELRRLNHGFGFTSILHTLAIMLQEQDVDCALIVAVAPLNEGEIREDRLKTVLCDSTLEELFPDPFRH